MGSSIVVRLSKPVSNVIINKTRISSIFIIIVAQAPSVFQVSIHPGSSQLVNNALTSQTNQPSGSNVNVLQHGFGSESTNSSLKIEKKKRLAYFGDVKDDEELGEESAQQYISVLRKKVMDQRKQTKSLVQKNRRSRLRISKLTSLLKELIEKTKNGNYVIEEA